MGNDHSGIDLENLLANDEFIELLVGRVAERLAARQAYNASAIKEAADGFRQVAQGSERLKFLGD